MSELEFWKKAYLVFGNNIITYAQLRDTFPEYRPMANSEKFERWGIESGLTELYFCPYGDTSKTKITIDEYHSTAAYKIIIRPEIMEHE